MNDTNRPVSPPTDSFDGVELVFPQECHFKVIAEDQESMHFVIETVLMELGIHAPVVEGNHSAQGRYVTYNISVRVESREMMNAIDHELRSIVGVRMVL
ncbi:MAG: DUF493 domain-containing protein [Spartobacteria bacterium]|nr:DUF493 domain-containing protein [Spartobacteria bacterium]